MEKRLSRRELLLTLTALTVLPKMALAKEVADMIEKLVLSNDEWKKRLTKEQYYILREEGTERAFTGPYWDNKDKGIYHCAGCDLPVFSSETKYESGTGWPSFWKPISPDVIGTKEDRTWYLAVRTEVHCARCEGHFGHVFNDGPQPTGLRYCLNGHALKFKKV